MDNAETIECTVEFASGYQQAVLLELPLDDAAEWWVAFTQAQSEHDLDDEPIAVYVGPEWRSSDGDNQRIPLDSDGDWIYDFEQEIVR